MQLKTVRHVDTGAENPKLIQFLGGGLQHSSTADTIAGGSRQRGRHFQALSSVF